AIEPVTPEHLFRIGSISKPITSAAVFSLIDQGKLTLDAKVFGAGGALGHDYGVSQNKFINDITIEHLLTHTVGDWSSPQDPEFFNEHMDSRQLIAWALENRPLRQPPGHKFAYSNFGYFLLGRIIEQLTGRSYEDYVQESILTQS